MSFCSSSHVLITEYSDIEKDYYTKNDTARWRCESVIKVDNDYEGFNTLTKKDIRRIRRKINRECQCNVAYIVWSIYEEFGKDESKGSRREIFIVADNLLIKKQDGEIKKTLYHP